MAECHAIFVGQQVADDEVEAAGSGLQRQCVGPAIAGFDDFSGRNGGIDGAKRALEDGAFSAIGQGEVAATPIQLANMTAAIANRGFFYTPHLIKKIGDREIEDPKYTQRKYTTIDAEHFEPVIQGMAEVYKKGTAQWLQVPGVEIAGKTGTVENYTRIEGVRTQLTDHSLFIAFAPVNNPRIALAVYIENGYYGARYAGHIASLLIEKYLKGEITRKDLEKRMLEKTLEHEYAKPYSGEEFKINEYVW